MRARQLQYVRYQVPDLDTLEAFLIDFGLARVQRVGQSLYMRGTGDAPFLYEAVRGEACRFLGAGFAVESRDHLDRLADAEGSGPVLAASTPGGGACVRMTMPDGFEIDALHGFEPAPPLLLPTPDRFNHAQSKPRTNRPVRTRVEAKPVLRLGHFVLHVTDHARSVAWLRERLGLIDSDHLSVPGRPGDVIGTFLRIDRDAQMVDHHCLLVLQADEPGVHHCSFEVHGLDAVMASHDHLLERGHQLDCGVGRHLLGSQIFDYWRDPFGFRIEHYTDGDVVNHLHQPSVFSGTADQTTQWGAKPPKDFFE